MEILYKKLAGLPISMRQTPKYSVHKAVLTAVLYLVFAILSLHSSERKSPLSSLKKDKEHTKNTHTQRLTLFLSAPYPLPFGGGQRCCPGSVTPPRVRPHGAQETPRRRRAQSSGAGSTHSSGPEVPPSLLLPHGTIGEGSPVPPMPYEERCSMEKPATLCNPRTRNHN